MTMKAITPIVAVIMLVLLTITIVGIAFTFFNRSMDTASTSVGGSVEQTSSNMQANIEIENVNNNQVYIRNTGLGTINDLVFYVDNVRAIASTAECPNGLTPGQTCMFTLGGVANGEHIVKVSSSAHTEVSIMDVELTATTTTTTIPVFRVRYVNPLFTEYIYLNVNPKVFDIATKSLVDGGITGLGEYKNFTSLTTNDFILEFSETGSIHDQYSNVDFGLYAAKGPYLVNAPFDGTYTFDGRAGTLNGAPTINMPGTTNKCNVNGTLSGCSYEPSTNTGTCSLAVSSVSSVSGYNNWCQYYRGTSITLTTGLPFSSTLLPTGQQMVTPLIPSGSSVIVTGVSMAPGPTTSCATDINFCPYHTLIYEPPIWKVETIRKARDYPDSAYSFSGSITSSLNEYCPSGCGNFQRKFCNPSQYHNCVNSNCDPCWFSETDGIMSMSRSGSTSAFKIAGTKTFRGYSEPYYSNSMFQATGPVTDYNLGIVKSNLISGGGLYSVDVWCHPDPNRAVPTTTVNDVETFDSNAAMIDNWVHCGSKTFS